MAVPGVTGVIRKSSHRASSKGSHPTKDDRTSRLAQLMWVLPTETAPAASAKREGWDLKTLTLLPAGVYAAFEYVVCLVEAAWIVFL